MNETLRHVIPPEVR